MVHFYFNRQPIDVLFFRGLIRWVRRRRRRCDTPRWCVVCAMVIVLLLLLLLLLGIQTGSCQSSGSVLTDCSFANQTYLANAALLNQFQFTNRTSIVLRASYAFAPLSTFELGLIYQFSTSNYLLPFPIVFDCASLVRSCQLKTMTGTTGPSRNSEPIRVQLTRFNYSNVRTASPFNQMGLYLKQGRYQLSNCTLNDGHETTDPQTIFHLNIQYEKSVGKCSARLRADRK